MNIDLNIYQTLAAATAVYYIGVLLRLKIPFLRRYCIPAPVIGGILFGRLVIKTGVRNLCSWALIIGGVLYALKLKKLNAMHPHFGSHEIFHLFVLAGSACQYVTMFYLV